MGRVVEGTCGDLPVIMIGALYCRSKAVLLAMHVWLYVVAVLYLSLIHI